MVKRHSFPWAVAGVAFLFYALTLSHGVTLSSLSLTARVAGWEGAPTFERPVTWLLTQPLKLLPLAWVAVGLNLLFAALAAMVLGVLTRSVELLPWTCPPDARKVWAARLPAILAATALGLGFYFWRAATAAMVELPGLALLAVAIWCLLEFRAGERPGWLHAAAVIWGVGMAESWVMLVTLPFFIGALAVLRGRNFFRKTFLLRMGLLGLAGFSVYLLLPVVNAATPHSSLNLWEALKASGQSTKGIFRTLYYPFWSWHRLLTFAVLLFFLVPAVACLVRFKNETAKNLPDLDRWQLWFFRGLRTVLLLACVWLAFDPEVGPRAIVRQQLDVSLPLLTFDYLNAVAIAMLAGNLLFASQWARERRPPSALDFVPKFFRRWTFALLGTLALGMAAGLLARNVSAIGSVNRVPLDGFGRLVAGSLPDGGGILLGEDAGKLAVIRAAQVRTGAAADWQLVNLRLVARGDYRAGLQRVAARGWTDAGTTGDLKLNDLATLLSRLTRTNPVCLLPPVNGFFLFEQFAPQPMALVWGLRAYPTNSLVRFGLSAGQVAAGEKIWETAWRYGLARWSAPEPRPDWWQNFLRDWLALSAVRDEQQRQLRQWYAAALNEWAVALQVNGELASAQRRFEQAARLDPQNPAAATNLLINAALRAGQNLAALDFEDIGSRFRNVQQLVAQMSFHGMFDDPTVRLTLGQTYLAAGWPRQAWLEFERARQLAPHTIPPDFALAKLYSQLGFPSRALEATGRLRARTNQITDSLRLEAEIALIEARAWLVQTNLPAALQVLDAFQRAHRENGAINEAVLKAYLAIGARSNALALVERQLQLQPDSISALNNRAALLIQDGHATAALPALDRALALTNTPSIRLNRAIARLQAKDLAGAKADYLQLEKSPVDMFSVQYGLAEIAVREQQTNEAIRRLQICLTNVPADSLKARQVRLRLETLQPTNPH